MFWIALELSIPKIGFNIKLSLTVKKLDAFKFDGVAESDNTGSVYYVAATSRLCCRSVRYPPVAQPAAVVSLAGLWRGVVCGKSGVVCERAGWY